MPINPSQALDAMEALRGLTVEPYRTIGRTGGVLAVGAPADITVLDRDPRTVTPDSLGEAVVLLTVVGGRVVVDAGDRAPVTTRNLSSQDHAAAQFRRGRCGLLLRRAGQGTDLTPTRRRCDWLSEETDA